LFSFAGRVLGSWIVSAILVGTGINTVNNTETAMSTRDVVPVTVLRQKTPGTTVVVRKASSVVFGHGDISWLPILAAEAGWPEDTWDTLGQIILRESGGCPNRRGGDMVDKNCNITGVSEWNHRSDTGLLQINGVNYDPTRNKWSAICREINICTQEPLLDPVMNLKAGLILYKYSGWGPWDPCTWGPEYKKHCNRTKKLKP